MRKDLAIGLVVSVMIASAHLACTDYDDAPAETADASVPDSGPSTNSDAAVEASRIEPDADSGSIPSPCQEAFCDGFEGGMIAPEWMQVSEGNGSIFLDTAHPHSRTSSFRASLPGHSSTARAVLQRSVPTTGVGTWKAWVWVQSVQPTNPIKLMEIAFNLDTDHVSAASVHLDDSGLKLLREHGVDGSDATLMRTSMALGQWVELAFHFDFPGQKVSVDVNGAPSVALTSTDFDFGSFDGVTSIRLGLGVTSFSDSHDIVAWFDDTTFTTVAK